MYHNAIQDALEADYGHISFNLARAFLLDGFHEYVKMLLEKRLVMDHKKPQAFKCEASNLEALMLDVHMNGFLVCLVERHALDTYPDGF